MNIKYALRLLASFARSLSGVFQLLPFSPAERAFHHVSRPDLQQVGMSMAIYLVNLVQFWTELAVSYFVHKAILSYVFCMILWST